MRRIRRGKDSPHEAQRSYHHGRRRRCGTGRPCCAGESLLEEGCHPEEGRAQGPKTAKGAKPTIAKNEGKAGKKAEKPAMEASRPRAESKGAKILELIGRPKGATLAEIMKATAWQAHSVRGFLSTAWKKRGTKIESAKNDAGDRVYQIKK